MTEELLNQWHEIKTRRQTSSFDLHRVQEQIRVGFALLKAGCTKDNDGADIKETIQELDAVASGRQG